MDILIDRWEDDCQTRSAVKEALIILTIMWQALKDQLKSRP
jgi:hypothetical protein